MCRSPIRYPVRRATPAGSRPPPPPPTCSACGSYSHLTGSENCWKVKVAHWEDRAFTLTAQLDKSWTRQDWDAIGGFGYLSKEPTEEEVQAAIPQLQTRRHMKKELVRTNVHSSEGPWRCYRTGSEDWSRQDGGPLTERDIRAIKGLCYGQSTGTSAVAGDLVAHVRWECDSSD